MGHYRSNLRDLEFNLFEVFGLQDRLGHRAVRRAGRRHRARRARRGRAAGAGPLADSFADGDRNPPVYDPADPLRDAARRFQKSYQRAVGRRVVAPRAARRARRHGRPPRVRWAAGRADPRRQRRRCSCTAAAPLRRASSTASAPSSRSAGRELMIDRELGRDDGAHRARRRLRRRRRAAPRPSQQADGTWHIEGVKRFITTGDYDLTENIVHLVLARPEGARRPAPRACRCSSCPKFHFDPETGELGERNGVVRHQRRAQDGPQGLGHLRADLRRARRPGRRAGWSATCTTASRRCSRSSSTRG